MLEETLIEWRDTARKEGLREGRQEGRREGQREGQREGRREGRQEGQIEGRRQFLLEQLEQRFGALSSKVRRKVKVSSEEKLKELGKRVLVAGSLAEMGLE